MLLSPSLRKLALLAHITTSIGWIGAVAAFLVLALTGLQNPYPDFVRAAYLALEPVTWYTIIPLGFTALLTGLLLSLGTKLGLFRHYWIIFKLGINLLSLIILLLHTSIIHQVTAAAVAAPLSPDDLRGPRIQLVGYSIAALAALLLATILSVYKPRGLTPYGWRKQG